jgi:hypothetical protein
MSHGTRHLAEAASEYAAELSEDRIAGWLSGLATCEQANQEFHRLTGIRSFFEQPEAFTEFRRLITRPDTFATPRRREWGDYQTAPDLAQRVCDYLVDSGVTPNVIIEPTFGTGNFILAAFKAFPTARTIYGVELQERYVWHTKIALLLQILHGERRAPEIELHHGNIFTHHFPREITEAEGILIIGNPPWVTSSELGVLEAENRPQKQNIKGLNGIAAVTGKSNFDLGEFILLRLLEFFSKRRGTLAMLCKNSIIKNIVEILLQREFPVADLRALEIDATREFDAAVEASLLVMRLGASEPTRTCRVATLDAPQKSLRVFGWTRNKFVSNVEDYEALPNLDGKSSLIWRQGVKHDCSRVMELDVQENRLTNGDGEIVSVEEDRVYWLLKSSDLRGFEVSRARKKLILTQTKLSDNTTTLERLSPRLYAYLLQHGQYLDKRKSSIYRNKPRFAIFGIGEYSFKLYKVAISGLYKEPNFALVLPMDNRPTMLDDTCYFLGFDTYSDALFTNSILNSPLVKRFLRSVVFADAKRPYTKEVLMRIDLGLAASQLSFETLRCLWQEIGYKPRESISELEWERFKQSLFTARAHPADFQLELEL